jgi:hypothetical protein
VCFVSVVLNKTKAVARLSATALQRVEKVTRKRNFSTAFLIKYIFAVFPTA